MRPTGDDRINIGLAVIGRYTIQQRSWVDRLFRMPTVFEWSSPVGLENDLTEFILRFFIDTTSRGKIAGFERLLEAWDMFRKRFPDYVPQFTEYLVELFRGCYLEELPPHGKAQYLGADLKVSDSAILKHVSGGTVGLSWDGRKVTQQVWFSVDWDHEHRADVEFDAAGNLLKPWKQSEADPED